jgi:hypothetical protein
LQLTRELKGELKIMAFALKLPGKLITKPVASVAATPKAKREIKGDDYRKLRKWTTLKLLPFVEEGFAKELRNKIGSGNSGEVTANELVAYLTAIEGEGKEWTQRVKDPNALPKKRGRKSKAELEALAASVTPAPTKAAAKDILASARAGTLLKPKVAPVAPAAPKFAIPEFAPKK